MFNHTQTPLSIEFDTYGIAWFEARQIAKILGYARTQDMLRMVAPNERGRTKCTPHFPNLLMVYSRLLQSMNMAYIVFVLVQQRRGRSLKISNIGCFMMYCPIIQCILVTPIGLDYFLNFFKYYYPKLDGGNVDNE